MRASHRPRSGSPIPAGKIEDRLEDPEQREKNWEARLRSVEADAKAVYVEGLSKGVGCRGLGSRGRPGERAMTSAASGPGREGPGGGCVVP